jgi:lysophospholipase L1-like esterase
VPNETTTSADTMTSEDTTATEPATGAKYLALGDSYTIGQSVLETERFPSQTVKLLRAQNINIRDVEYIATTGWTTTDLLSAINSQKPEKNFDIVSLLIGVNDQYEQRDTTGYGERFSALLNIAVGLAGGRNSRVFVLSIPDYSVTPFVPEKEKALVSMQIEQFNTINKEITLQNNITYIDITPSTRQAATDASLIANDGLHPSAKEYAVWASMLAPLIKKALQ